MYQSFVDLAIFGICIKVTHLLYIPTWITSPTEERIETGWYPFLWNLNHSPASSMHFKTNYIAGIFCCLPKLAVNMEWMVTLNGRSISFAYIHREAWQSHCPSAGLVASWWKKHMRNCRPLKAIPSSESIPLLFLQTWVQHHSLAIYTWKARSLSQAISSSIVAYLAAEDNIRGGNNVQAWQAQERFQGYTRRTWRQSVRIRRLQKDRWNQMEKGNVRSSSKYSTSEPRDNLYFQISQSDRNHQAHP